MRWLASVTSADGAPSPEATDRPRPVRPMSTVTGTTSRRRRARRESPQLPPSARMRRQLMMPAHPPMTKNRGMIWKNQEAMANPVVPDSATVGTTLPSGPMTAALISEWRTTTTTRQAKRTRSMAGSRRDRARVVGPEDVGGGQTGVLRDAEPEDVGGAAWELVGGGAVVAGCGAVATADGPSRVRDMGAPGTVLR